MEKYIYNEKNGLWYELQGDYYLPCPKLPKEETVHIDIWGQRHRYYLKNLCKALYQSLFEGACASDHACVLPRVISQANLYAPDGVCDYFPMWICVGLPFGIRRMCLWLVPSGYGISGSVGIFALNLIIGGLIGGLAFFIGLLLGVIHTIREII